MRLDVGIGGNRVVDARCVVATCRALSRIVGGYQLRADGPCVSFEYLRGVRQHCVRLLNLIIKWGDSDFDIPLLGCLLNSTAREITAEPMIASSSNLASDAA